MDVEPTPESFELPAALRISTDGESLRALRMLHTMWERLSAALTVDNVIDIVLTEGVDRLGAANGSLMLVSPDGASIDIVGSVGFGERVVDHFGSVPLDAELPICDAIRRGEPVLIDSIAERDARYPGLASWETDNQAFAVVPFVSAQGKLGGFSLGFTSARTFTDVERELLIGLGRQCTQALERARLIEQLQQSVEHEQRARERLVFLTEAGEALASTLGYLETLDRLAQLAVPKFADWCVVDVVNDAGEIERVSVAHTDPAKVEFGWEVTRRNPTTVDVATGTANVIRTGVAEIAPHITDDMLVAGSRGDDWLDSMRQLGMTSAMIVPLTVRGRTLGAMSFVQAESGRVYGEDDLALAQQLAGRVAIAIDNALMFDELEARARAAQVLAHVGDGVFMVDRAGRVALWNQAAETIVGVSESTVVGRPARTVVPGWELIDERVPVSRLPHSGSVHNETLPLLQAGREVWVSISGVEFPGGTVYAFRDVTDEREIERMKADFVATVSHELRTPLASVYGSAITLQRGDVPMEPETREQLLDIIADESHRLSTIINDILLASHIDSGRIELTTAPFDLGELLEAVVDSARLRLDEATTSLELTLPDGGLELHGDHGRLRQIVVNMVENAMKYSPDGGRIEVGARAVGAGVRIWVRDEGIGIPARERRRIFEKFYRLDPNQTRGVGGTGLGLYICRELVRRMGGDIAVGSNEGPGSTFTVTLPLVMQV